MKWNPPFQTEMKTGGFAMLHPPYYYSKLLPKWPA